MWFAEVKAKAKRKNQILFSKDSLLLADPCQPIAQANRRALILWALELAEENARELAGKYPEDFRPREAIATSRVWAAGGIKMPMAKQAILNFCFQQVPPVMINIFFVLKYTDGCVLVLLSVLARRIKPILM